MKKGWEYKTLGDCAIKVQKQKQVKSKDYKETGKYPIVSQEKELISGYWDDESYLYRHIKPIIVFGDHTKEVKYIDFDFVVGADGTQLLMPKDGINPKYFYYVIKATPLRALGYARHFKLLKEKQYPVPPLSEQEEIVSRLDKAFEKIDTLRHNAEKSLTTAQQLFQSSLTNLLTPQPHWGRHTLSEYYDITSSKRVFQKDWKSDGIPFYRAREIVKINKYGFVNNDLFISESMYNEYKGKYGVPKIGDILVTGVGTLGVCLVIKSAKKFYYKDGNIIWLKKKKDINSDYVAAQFLCPYVIKQVYKNEGTTVGTYTISSAKNTEIWVPPLPEQAAIVAKLDSLSAKVKQLKDNYTRTVALCDEMKQALLKEVFE